MKTQRTGAKSGSGSKLALEPAQRKRGNIGTCFHDSCSVKFFSGKRHIVNDHLVPWHTCFSVWTCHEGGDVLSIAFVWIWSSGEYLFKKTPNKHALGLFKLNFNEGVGSLLQQTVLEHQMLPVVPSLPSCPGFPVLV